MHEEGCFGRPRERSPFSVRHDRLRHACVTVALHGPNLNACLTAHSSRADARTTEPPRINDRLPAQIKRTA
jgi:hypothetical protein